MADDGGSSGRLRRELGVLPPGDVRKALLALADPHSAIGPLLAYRFLRGELAGHPVGNLVLAALADLKGGFIEAVDATSRLLGLQGRVLPSTLVPVELRGRVDGREVHGQNTLTRIAGRIEHVWLEPAAPAAVPAAVVAVAAADLVVIGPGSTFTSLIPNLLVPDLAAALVGRPERVVYVCNLQSQQAETSGFLPEAHLAALLAHCPGLAVGRVLCQRPADALARAREVRAFAELGAEVVHAELLATHRPERHDPALLATTLRSLLGSHLE
jgi:uncharacterized cofD-like protein